MHHPFAAKPIAILDQVPTTAQSASVPIDGGDPRAQEPLVDLRQKGILGRAYYAVADGSNPPYGQAIEGAIPALLVRRSLAEKLLAVEQGLKPYGLRLYVYDGFRPIATQLGIWTFMRRHIEAAMPGASVAAIEAETAKFASDPRAFSPSNPASWPIHSTGGAVDLALAREDGSLLDFGAGFDEMTPAAATDYFERQRAAGAIGERDSRLLHRRILYWAMRDAGCTNYRHEYWHYDFGDQMYVLSLQALSEAGPAKAFYPYAGDIL
jgi:D-alanyl-D-alanine dipeptidase